MYYIENPLIVRKIVKNPQENEMHKTSIPTAGNGTNFCTRSFIAGLNALALRMSMLKPTCSKDKLPNLIDIIKVSINHPVYKILQHCFFSWIHIQTISYSWSHNCITTVCRISYSKTQLRMLHVSTGCNNKNAYFPDMMILNSKIFLFPNPTENVHSI
jgi:hypothetical protein